MTSQRDTDTERFARALGRTLMASELVAVIGMDGHGRVQEWGGAAPSLFGHTREAMLGRDLAEAIIPPDLRDAHRTALTARLRDPAPLSGRRIELLALRADGSEFPAAISISQVLGAEPPAFVGLIRDITGQREADFRLAKSQSLLAAAEAAGLTGSFDRDLRTGAAEWSAGMYGIHDQPTGSPVPDNERLIERIHPSDRPAARAAMAALIRDRPASFEQQWRLDRPGHEERVIATRGRVVVDELGQAERIVGIVQDVTETWRAQRTRDLLAYVVQSSDDAILTKRADGTITSWNEGAERLYGYPAEEIVGRSVNLLAPAALHAEQDDLTRRVFAGESVRHQEAERVRKDGSRLLVSLTMSPVRDPTGRIVSAAVVGRDVTERRALEQRLRHQAEHDPLTGLFNRRRFEAELGRELARIDRHGGSGVVLSLDLDQFKQVNDTGGHAAGDALLCEVAQTLRRTLRESDVAARLGGDEFAVLLPATAVADAGTVGQHLLSALRDVQVEVESVTARVSASIGGIGFEDRQLEAEELLIGADLAMYQAKEQGRDRVVIFTPEEAEQAREGVQVSWSRRISQALEEEQLVLHWQPIVELASGRTAYGELLLRMRSDRGLIEPDEFLGVAERLGLMHAIDRWVIRRAIGLLADGRTPEGLPLSVNLAGATVAGDSELLEVITHELAGQGVDPGRIHFEVSETAAVANLPGARRFAFGVRALGCRLGLDDFGAGFGSFLYLKHLPVDFIKIDQEFIHNLPASLIDQRLVGAIADVARELGIATVAEAVSDTGTLVLLREMGVEYAQGFHFGAPRPLD